MDNKNTLHKQIDTLVKKGRKLGQAEILSAFMKLIPINENTVKDNTVHVDIPLRDIMAIIAKVNEEDK